MFWLTWRQFRAQAIAGGAVLAAFAITFVITGITLRSRYDAAGLPGCHATHACEQLATNFISQLRAGGPYDGLFNAGTALLYVVPGLIGLFWGAPLVARELETGTLRLAWNQSVSRSRWLAIKLGVVGAAAMATAGLFSLLITWWVSPVERALDEAGPSVNGLSRLDPAIFGVRDIVPVGYAAFALALGVTFGVLIRRTVPAMAATLGVVAAVEVVWPKWIRQHLIPPSVVRQPLALGNLDELSISVPGREMTVVGAWHQAGAWVLSNQTITPAGHAFTGPAAGACLGNSSQQACLAWLARQHLRQLVTFQPASRFWAFQWYETAIFVLLAVALAGLCSWRIRNRRLA